VLNIHKKNQVLLVFPTVARIIDNSSLLIGKFSSGRKTAKFTKESELKERKNDLVNFIRIWIDSADR